MRGVLIVSSRCRPRHMHRSPLMLNTPPSVVVISFERSVTREKNTCKFFEIKHTKMGALFVLLCSNFVFNFIGVLLFSLYLQSFQFSSIHLLFDRFNFSHHFLSTYTVYSHLFVRTRQRAIVQKLSLLTDGWFLRRYCQKDNLFYCYSSIYSFPATHLINKILFSFLM